MVVEYTRAEGYPKEHLENGYAIGANQAIDKLYCAWTERHLLANELLAPANPLLIAKYAVPQDFRDVYALSVDIEGVGLDPDTSPLTPKKAALTVQYGTLEATDEWRKHGAFLVQETLEPAIEFITLDAMKYQWRADPGFAEYSPVTDVEAPTYKKRMFDWVYTSRGHLSVPDWVQTHIGSINSAKERSSHFGMDFEEGTLLCGNPTIQKNHEEEKSRFEITTRLTWNPEGWNFFPFTGKNLLTGEYEIIHRQLYDLSGNKIEFYTKLDFSEIFSSI